MAAPVIAQLSTLIEHDVEHGLSGLGLVGHAELGGARERVGGERVGTVAVSAAVSGRECPSELVCSPDRVWARPSLARTTRRRPRGRRRLRRGDRATSTGRPVGRPRRRTPAQAEWAGSRAGRGRARGSPRAPPPIARRAAPLRPRPPSPARRDGTGPMAATRTHRQRTGRSGDRVPPPSTHRDLPELDERAQRPVVGSEASQPVEEVVIAATPTPRDADLCRSVPGVRRVGMELRQRVERLPFGVGEPAVEERDRRLDHGDMVVVPGRCEPRRPRTPRRGRRSRRGRRVAGTRRAPP